ncbi:MAG: VOC family protein [Planctomycetota bacterium]
MPNPLSHFSIHADDVERARDFYEAIFGWTIEPWGPPGFLMIYPDGDREAPVHGSIQQRRGPLSGEGVRGFECSFAVEDLGAIAEAVEAQGGRILMRDFEIPTVGTMTHSLGSRL